MGGFYQGKGGGKGAAAAAPAAAGGEELPGGLKRKLQALGYPVPWRTWGYAMLMHPKATRQDKNFSADENGSSGTARGPLLSIKLR